MRVGETRTRNEIEMLMKFVYAVCSRVGRSAVTGCLGGGTAVAIALLLACPSSARAVADTARIAWKDSTQLLLSFPVRTGDDARVGSDYRLFVTPCLSSEEGDTLLLPPIEFAGRRNKKYNDRAARLAGAPRPVVHGVDDVVQVDTALAVEPWMLRAPLSLTLLREREGCCTVDALPPAPLGGTRYVEPFVPLVPVVEPRLSVAEELARTETILTADCPPYDPSQPLRLRQGALFVYFPINKYDLREDFRDNRPTLDRIVDVLRRVKADTASHVTRVLIVGQASPEGSVGFNEMLGRRRAEALRDYIDSRVDFPDDIYDVQNGGEAWADLRYAVEQASPQELPDRDELLRIIDETRDVNYRETLIRRLSGGRAFRWLKQSALVDQRNSGYICVCYQVVPDRVAPVINRAVALVADRRYSEAVEVLAPVRHDPRCLNTLGVALYMSGQKDEGIDCLRRAATTGDEGARQNLEKLAEAGR